MYLENLLEVDMSVDLDCGFCQAGLYNTDMDANASVSTATAVHGASHRFFVVAIHWSPALAGNIIPSR